MSYPETSAIMGCAAKSLSPSDAGGIATAEWDGPESPFLMATDIDFLDSRLLYYTTRSRGGY